MKKLCFVWKKNTLKYFWVLGKKSPDNKLPTKSPLYKSPKKKQELDFLFKDRCTLVGMVYSVNGIFRNNLFNNPRGLLSGGFCPCGSCPGAFLSGAFDQLPIFVVGQYHMFLHHR